MITPVNKKMTSLHILTRDFNERHTIIWSVKEDYHSFISFTEPPIQIQTSQVIPASFSFIGLFFPSSLFQIISLSRGLLIFYAHDSTILFSLNPKTKNKLLFKRNF